MPNSKYNNMLRIISGAILPPFLYFSLLQNLSKGANLALLALLSFIIVICVYPLSMIRGLVITLGFIYLFVLFCLYAFFVKSMRPDYLSPVLVIFAAYLAVNLYKYIAEIVKEIALKNKAVVDSLTGIFTQRYFQVKVEDEFSRAAKRKTNLSLILIAVVGADMGKIAQLIKKISRDSDFIARYGEAGVCAILAQEKAKGALSYVEKLEKAIKNNITGNINLGIVNFPDTDVKSWQEFLQCAELALRKAKETGAIYVYRAD